MATVTRYARPDEIVFTLKHTMLLEVCSLCECYGCSVDIELLCDFLCVNRCWWKRWTTHH